MNKKEVLIMAHQMRLGGTEKALLAFINVFKSKNVNVTLLLLEDGGELYDEIPGFVKVKILKNFEKIKPIIYHLPTYQIKNKLIALKLFSVVSSLIRHIKIKITGKWYLNYKEALKKEKVAYEADLAIAYAGPSDFISYYILKHVKAPEKLQWIHFDVSKIIFNKTFGNAYYKDFDKIYCVSENAKLVFDTMFPRLSHKTFIFKSIISKSKLEKLAAIGDTYNDGFTGLRILTLGRLSKEKGQQMIPEIVKKLKADHLNFKWYLIGNGNTFEEIKNQINKLEIENELIMLGPKTNPYCFVKDCDIYVQTSFHEGYCLTVHEAKIFNRPVVVTNFPNASNLIKHNQDGLIVHSNKQRIYEGVKSLLTNEELRVLFQRNLLCHETLDTINSVPNL